MRSVATDEPAEQWNELAAMPLDVPAAWAMLDAQRLAVQQVSEQPAWRQAPVLVLPEVQQASLPWEQLAQEQLVQPQQVQQVLLQAVPVEQVQQAASPDAMVAADDVDADCEQHSECECGS